MSSIMSKKHRVVVLETSPGQFRWQLQDASGKIVPIKFGKVMGAGNASKLRAAKSAANTALGEVAKKGGGTQRTAAQRSVTGGE
jgi:hypothetical protein